MKTQDSSTGRMESLGFSEAVAQHAAPVLIARGFVCIEAALHSVKFQSPHVALAVFHDPVSYEIDVVLARQAAPSERYDLRDMLDAVLGPGHKEQVYFQASEHDRVAASIKTISELLRRHGEAALAGEPAVYQQIGQAARRHNEAYTKKVVQVPIREAAEDAWRKQDYARVRDLLEPVEADLTPAEKKRLDYARSHSPSP